jgi:hypothetical protein
MQQEIIFKAIPVTERQPENYGSIHHVLLDGRLPLMAQYNPGGWHYVGGQRIGGSGVTHWLERQPERQQEPPMYFFKVVNGVISRVFRSENFYDCRVVDAGYNSVDGFFVSIETIEKEVCKKLKIDNEETYDAIVSLYSSKKVFGVKF